MENSGEAFKKLCDVVARLRGPGGCPWDIEQTPQSLRGDLIEETYECVEAIDEKDPGHIMEELGDLFLVVTMISYMHEQAGLFSLEDVLRGVTEKLVRRHPHVFGKVKVGSSAEVLQNWAKIKVEVEGRKPKESLMDEVSGGLPPLDRAYKLQKKAAKAGFDWSDAHGVIAKIQEELGETLDALRTNDSEAIEEELGDLLFSVVNLCRFQGTAPSVALQRANAKFVRRFKHIERRMKECGLAPGSENLAAMESFWQEAKKTLTQAP
jgi:tetrapyrrole methylase family protein/MazG family protein